MCFSDHVFDLRKRSRTFFGECPYCHGKGLKKYGKGYGRQRWACANCGRTFSGRTRTILHSSKLKPSQIRRLVSMLSDGATLRQAAHQAHVSLQTDLPCIGEEPVLSFQLSREGSRGRWDPHDGHKDGEAEPGRSREIHHLCPRTAWEGRSGRHRQTSSVVRKRRGHRNTRYRRASWIV